ncbi:hypothetical protein S245_048893 [Arachis hypogaea]|nr:uncharacterized protein DS421_14g470080 [Arachis hypogaea]
MTVSFVRGTNCLLSSSISQLSNVIFPPFLSLPLCRRLLPLPPKFSLYLHLNPSLSSRPARRSSNSSLTMSTSSTSTGIPPSFLEILSSGNNIIGDDDYSDEDKEECERGGNNFDNDSGEKMRRIGGVGVRILELRKAMAKR